MNLRLKKNRRARTRLVIRLGSALISLHAIIALFASQPMLAQEVEPVLLIVHKISDNNESGFQLGFWIHEKERFTRVTEASRIMVAKDNKGLDLLKAHQKEVQKARIENTNQGRNQHLVDLQQSRTMRDTTGFLLVLNCWALPSKGAKKLRIKAEIEYQIIASDSLKTEVWQGIDIETTNKLILNGVPIPISKQKIWDSVKGDMYRYSIDNADLEAFVQGIHLVDNAGNTVEELTPMVFTDRTDFSVKRGVGKINFKMTYKNILTKKIGFDQQLNLGL